MARNCRPRGGVYEFRDLKERKACDGLRPMRIIVWNVENLKFQVSDPRAPIPGGPPRDCAWLVLLTYVYYSDPGEMHCAYTVTDFLVGSVDHLGERRKYKRGTNNGVNYLHTSSALGWKILCNDGARDMRTRLSRVYRWKSIGTTSRRK